MLCTGENLLFFITLLCFCCCCCYCFPVVPLGSLYLLKPIHGGYSKLPVEPQQASNPWSEPGSLQSHVPSSCPGASGAWDLTKLLKIRYRGMPHAQVCCPVMLLVSFGEQSFSCHVSPRAVTSRATHLLLISHVINAHGSYSLFLPSSRSLGKVELLTAPLTCTDCFLLIPKAAWC